MFTIIEREDFDEKRDKRRKFLAKASYNLRISQDELEQKKQTLSQSFESKSVERRKLHSSSVPRSRLGQSLPRGNTKQPLRTSNDHENKTQDENIQTDYFEDLLNPKSTNDERTENNLHSNNYNKPFDTKRLQGSERETPFLNLGATTTLSNTFSKIPIPIQGENRGALFTQTDCSTNFDGDYGFFEGKLKDLLEKEKKQIIEMNTSQIAQLEEKMKDKYNFMVKKVLETQAKENQDKSRLVSQASQTQEPTFQTPIVKVNPRGYNISSAAKDNLLNNSMYSDIQTNNLKERNSYFNTTHLLSEIKHMKHDLFGPSEVKVSRKLFPQNENLNESLQFIRRISDSYQPENNEESNFFAEKINELEATNKNLLMKVSFLEGVVSSTMKNNSAVKILLGQNPQKENLENSFTKTKNNSSPCITPQKEKNNDFSSNQQIAEQLKIMNKKIDHLTKANQELTAKNKELTENIQALTQTSQKDQGESAEFWKEKCKVLVEKYFQVIKKIKSDHQSVKEDLQRDYNKLKSKISSKNTGEIHQFISTMDLNEMFAQQPGQKQRSSSQQQPKNRELRSASRKNRENIPN